MMRMLKIILAAVVAICLIAVAGVYALSEMRLSRTYDVAVADFTVKTTLPAEEAERRARTLMCGGCHHDAGNVLIDEPGVGRIVAPNLTRFVPMYSDAELVRLIRHGVKKDGTGAFIMPASNFANITDDDMAAIIAWMRSLKQLPDAVAGTTQWGPLGRIGLALDKIPFEADLCLPWAPLPRRVRPISANTPSGPIAATVIISIRQSSRKPSWRRRLSPWRNPIRLPISGRCCAPARVSATAISA